MKTRKKGILFFAVVAGIMLSSGVTIAINPAQWFGDPTANIDEITDEEIDAFGPVSYTHLTLPTILLV